MIPRALRRLAARSRLRTALLLALIGGLAVLLVAAPAALGDAITPESGGSPNADDIDRLYKITLYIGIVIFLIVEGTLIWSLVRYRFRRGGRPPAQIRGNTPLEVGWTIAAAVILVALTTVTFVFLTDIKNPPNSDPGGLASAGGKAQYASIDQPAPPDGRALEIDVNGQQYLWRYDYPGREQVFSYFEMVVPTKTTVTLNITSSDVVHSWWIPKLGGKADAVPGYTNETWFKIDKPGIYEGQCAELCGAGHADMRGQVRAVPPAEYERWLTRQAEAIRESQEALAQARREREAAGQPQ